MGLLLYWATNFSATHQPDAPKSAVGAYSVAPKARQHAFYSAKAAKKSEV